MFLFELSLMIMKIRRQTLTGDAKTDRLASTIDSFSRSNLKSRRDTC